MEIGRGSSLGDGGWKGEERRGGVVTVMAPMSGEVDRCGRERNGGG